MGLSRQKKKSFFYRVIILELEENTEILKQYFFHFIDEKVTQVRDVPA